MDDDAIEDTDDPLSQDEMSLEEDHLSEGMMSPDSNPDPSGQPLASFREQLRAAEDVTDLATALEARETSDT